MSDAPPQYGETDLLTIREVARLLKLKPDTLYRWARADRLPATKVGKEWRVAITDVERVVGRTLPRPHPTIADELDSYEEELSSNGKAIASTDQDALQRKLRSFLKPRDNLVALASDKQHLAEIEFAFWQTALAAGGPLLVPLEPGRLKEARKAFTSLGYDTKILRREGRLLLHEVEGIEEAKRAIRIEAGKGATVWTTFGLTQSLVVPKQLAFDNARDLDATCITCNAIILSGWQMVKKSWTFDDAWRLEAAHRGSIRLWQGEAAFNRFTP